MVFRSSKEKPKIDHLWIIGCTAYVHINKQLCTKLDAKSIKCILVGYGNDCKAYRVWNPKTNKVFYSRDVIFDENQIGSSNTITEDIPLIDINDLSSDNGHEYNIEQIIHEWTVNGQLEYYV